MYIEVNIFMDRILLIFILNSIYFISVRQCVTEFVRVIGGITIVREVFYGLLTAFLGDLDVGLEGCYLLVECLYLFSCYL